MSSFPLIFLKAHLQDLSKPENTCNQERSRHLQPRPKGAPTGRALTGRTGLREDARPALHLQGYLWKSPKLVVEVQI